MRNEIIYNPNPELDKIEQKEKEAIQEKYNQEIRSSPKIYDKIKLIVKKNFQLLRFSTYKNLYSNKKI